MIAWWFGLLHECLRDVHATRRRSVSGVSARSGRFSKPCTLAVLNGRAAQNVVELGPSPRHSAKSGSAISTRVRAAVNFSVRPVQCGAARLKTLRSHVTRAQAHSYHSLLSEDRRRPQEAKTQTGRRETRRFCGETRNEKSESVRRGAGEHGGSVGKREGSVGKRVREERECAAAANQPAARRLGVPLSGYFKNAVYPAAPECVTARSRTLKASRSVAGWRCARVRAWSVRSRFPEAADPR